MDYFMDSTNLAKIESFIENNEYLLNLIMNNEPIDAYGYE